ncbi:MAG: hypothetical protein L0271_18020 [Gemmatimonadetes bacterium]|nr:hypothetical protein [Gemmatimonadota bacterium]
MPVPRRFHYLACQRDCKQRLSKIVRPRTPVTVTPEEPGFGAPFRMRGRQQVFSQLALGDLREVSIGQEIHGSAPVLGIEPDWSLLVRGASMDG